MFDAFWRAVAYCLHPRLMLWSLLPFLLAAAAVLGLGALYWEAALAALNGALEQSQLWLSLMAWLDSVGAQRLHRLLAPLLIVLVAGPLVVVGSLVLVALFMTPAIVALVEKRRFPDLVRRHGATWWQQALWSLSCTAAALLALLLSLPLWLIPPLVLLLPPLIWGWLTCRVMAFDVLAAHADADERHALLRRHRWPLLAMGVVCGFFGGLPSLLWVFGIAGVLLFPVLVVLTVAAYTLLFAFSACWFAHYLLAALQSRRLSHAEAAGPVAANPSTALTTP